MTRGAIYKSVVNENNELERLFSLQFKECARQISKMDTLKKAKVAADVQKILDSLYIQVDRYGNSDYSRDEQIGPDMFVYLMGKIKRWETLLYWLYEIDIMMEETELDHLIKEAEDRIRSDKAQAEIAAGKEPTRIRLVKGDDGLKHRQVVNAREDLATLYAERTARGNHTDEIMLLAKSLTTKYFK